MNERKYGLDVKGVELKLALVLKGTLADLERIVNNLEKESGIFVVYKRLSGKRLSVMEEL